MDTRSRMSGPYTDATGEYVRNGGRYALATAVLDSIVLVFAIVIAFLLRASDIFPVRQQRFLCDDARYYQSYEDANTERNYIILSNVTLYIICLTVPIVVVSIIELIRSFISYSAYRTRFVIRFKDCLIRSLARILKYMSVFTFGALATTVLTDILKIMSGRLRPYFLTLCNPDQKSCNGMGLTDAEFVCLSKNMTGLLREARLSFPSLHASLSMYSAMFLAIYLHREIRIERVRIVKPFLILSIITLSVVAGGVRLASNKNHWEDVAFGFALGAIMATYLTKTLRSPKSCVGASTARTANYDDYQSYVEEQAPYNKEVDATYAPAMEAVYQTTGHSISGPEQFSLQPSASQGHIAGGFARHRYDLKTQMQQQQQQQAASQAAQQIPIDKTGPVVGRGEATNGVVQQLVHQIQHQPHTSTSSQRASTSMSALR
ncbi:unnamed protein product [Rotaria magnacalcarata]|uniref:Phosphatidic acid phosphatase type 2/haloperoxidase domain-containing protein n=2 Tax=Rotaria magnacalcarata TaxID=392030 RepID=A0A816V837_9BILA|nr:unnamed protein product [Rotaria magnacalcarata]CAF1564986.1 unnamed protein product [Rotaria magnacalcarata]CAF2121056.1 unnamed protein product [Rotaria magnacalcarata]CAF2187122.1 unnamed protein product [Rotaria magnacalcarata]CAF2243499.1 unnamed protein product [Rotaria magnacalcarata]